MTNAAPTTSVRSTVVVDAPVERAFTVFTRDIGTWWPPEHHLLQGELAEMVFEPRVGGNIYDRATDGTECRWSRVLAYEPPDRVVFSWDIGLNWELEADPSRTSEVEVTFVAEGPNRTRVELVHRNLDRHGDGWQGMASAVGAPNGWDLGMAAFAKALSASGR